MWGKCFKGIRRRKGIIPFQSSSQENQEGPSPKTMRLEDPHQSTETSEVSLLDENMEVDEEVTRSVVFATFPEAGIGCGAAGNAISKTRGEGQIGSSSATETQPWELYIRQNSKMRKFVSHPVREGLRMMGEESMNPKFPKTSIVAECMEKTFPVRQKDISTNELSPRRAIDLYPGLQDYEELRKEFGRVAGKDVDIFEQKVGIMLERYCYGALALQNKLCSTHQECRDARRILENNEERADSKFSASLVVFCCSESDGKWTNVLFKKNQEEEQSGDVNYSRIAVRGNLFEDYCSDVVLKEKRVMTPSTFYQTFLACYYLNLVLHIDVDNEVLENIFLPLLHILMRCPDVKKEIYEMMEDLVL